MGVLTNVAGSPQASPRAGDARRVVRSGSALRHDARPVHARAERQRIASALHDDVSSLLFAASAAAQHAGHDAELSAEELRAALRRVGDHVREASDRLRAVLRGCAPVDAVDGLVAAVRRDLLDLTGRTGIATRLVLHGTARPLADGGDTALLGCLRLSLFNVERHAQAREVEITLRYEAHEVVLEIVDDGSGLPSGFVPAAVPRTDGTGWGWSSVLRRAEQRGGHAELLAVPGGGTRVCVHLPA
ncbi:sensor histidine kinase [Pseudonocardia sp.]|uniref:sensor histidine kinase n=1 Tax=Pseudonocardia sp. TaxID=60912 RepID=UPI003D139712